MSDRREYPGSQSQWKVILFLYAVSPAQVLLSDRRKYLGSQSQRKVPGLLTQRCSHPSVSSPHSSMSEIHRHVLGILQTSMTDDVSITLTGCHFSNRPKYGRLLDCEPCDNNQKHSHQHAAFLSLL